MFEEVYEGRRFLSDKGLKAAFYEVEVWKNHRDERRVDLTLRLSDGDNTLYFYDREDLPLIQDFINEAIEKYNEVSNSNEKEEIKELEVSE